MRVGDGEDSEAKGNRWMRKGDGREIEREWGIEKERVLMQLSLFVSQGYRHSTLVRERENSEFEPKDVLDTKTSVSSPGISKMAVRDLGAISAPSAPTAGS